MRPLRLASVSRFELASTSNRTNRLWLIQSSIVRGVFGANMNIKFTNVQSSYRGSGSFSSVLRLLISGDIGENLQSAPSKPLHCSGECYHAFTWRIVRKRSNGGGLRLRYRLLVIFIPAPAAFCPTDNGVLYYGLPSESRKTRLNVLACCRAQISSSGGGTIVLSRIQCYRLLAS